jgi:hypothetical protein
MRGSTILFLQDSDGVFSAGYRMVRVTEAKLSVVTPDAAIGTYK